MERWIKLTDQLNKWHAVITPVEFASIVNKDLLKYYSFIGSDKQNYFKTFDEMKQFCIASTLSMVCSFRQYPQIVQDFYDENDESIDKVLNIATGYISNHSPEHRNFITSLYARADFEKDMTRAFAWAKNSYLRYDEVRSVEDIILGNTIENARILELERQLAEANQKNKTENPLDPRQRASYLKVIAAVICQKGDKQAIKEKGLAGKIARWTHGLGLPLSEDTTKKIIDEALDLLK